MAKKARGEGSVRQLPDGSFECVIQSKYLNPKTNTPKRIKRRGKNEKEAIKNCKMALKVWEKQFESGMLVKIDKKKTFGQYMEEFIDKEVKPNIAGSSYKSYVYTMQANFYNYKISKLQLHNLNKVEFEIFFDTLIHDKSYSTAELPIQLCKRCCTWLVGQSLLEEDYASFAKVKKEKKDEYFREKEKEKREQKEVFTNDDIIKFYYSYKNNISEYSAAVILLLETMMRGQEFLPLTLDDIDLENDIIHIRSAVSERFVDNDKNKGIEKYIKVPKNRKESLNVLSNMFAPSGTTQCNLFNVLILIAFAYCVIKIFFQNIKRGGILLIQIAVGSLYIFSVPRGYTDGFVQWVKQVVALCLTAFLQTTLLYLGLLTFNNSMLLGLGVMLAANEVPQIAQQFGLDTSTKINATSVMYGASSAMNLTRSITRVAGK